MNACRTLAPVILIASLVACTTPAPPDPAGPGRDFDDSHVSEIEKNVTSKADIRKNFGEPYSMATALGNDVWTYRYTTPAGTDAVLKDSKKKNLTISFNGDKVQDFTYTK